MNKNVIDKMGIPIKVGDYIVYRLLGRTFTGLQLGKVTKVDVFKDHNGQPLLTYTGALQPKLTVRRVRDDLNPPILAKRNSTLTCTDNILVYPQMPQWVKDLFSQNGL
jgi:hypothetical protein